MVGFTSPWKWRTSGSLPFMDIRITRQSPGEFTKEVYQKPTHTYRYVPFSSHHPISVKSGVVACLAYRAIRVSSSQSGRDAKLGRILNVMMCNSYPRQFIYKVLSSQLKRHMTSCALNLQQQTTNEPRPITVSIPFVEGLSPKVRCIAHTTGVRCAFFTPDSLCSLYTSKDRLATDSMTSAVYSVKCKTCAGDYVGKTLGALLVRKKEHCDAIRLGQRSKSAIVEYVHEQSMPH